MSPVEQDDIKICGLEIENVFSPNYAAGFTRAVTIKSHPPTPFNREELEDEFLKLDKTNTAAKCQSLM